jgi:hypothetical protein
MEKNQKASPITVEHWEGKFEKAIQILLKSGIKSEDLINKIKTEDEKNNKT